MLISGRRLALGILPLLASSAICCARPEDHARAELRDRLKQETRLSDEEIGRLFDEVERTIEGTTFSIKEGRTTRTQSAEQRAEAFSILGNRAGVFDEGLRGEGGTTYRVFNGPGRSNNAEIEATQRLWVDVETFLPFRYQFTYAVPGYGDYAYDLAVEP
jgi:hypothetical protein